MTSTLRIATRKSPLALWQAEAVANELRAIHPGLEVCLVPMRTAGDKLLDAPLAKVGGKGLFLKELEHALFERRADIAVHSMKDVPVAIPDGLVLPVVMARDDPRDGFVSNRYPTLDALPSGARVGTSSLRRKCQLRALRPDLELVDLRGGVNTRLGKLDNGEYDGIILASCGLKRLNMAERVREHFAPERVLPAIGQGAMGIECRGDDTTMRSLIAPLTDGKASIEIAAERGLNAALDGGCQVPIAGFAELQGATLRVRGLVASLDGRKVLKHEVNGARDEAAGLGQNLARALLDAGAGDILREVYADTG